MSAAQRERECRVYSRYLIGQDPTDYVLRKYEEFHQRSPRITAKGAFDRALVAVSRWSPLAARAADIYASRFAKDSALRRKLVLTLALLECSPPSFERLDAPDPGGLAALCLRWSYAGARFALLLLVAVATLGPLHLVASLTEARNPR
jgi:hypothetical protein